MKRELANEKRRTEETSSSRKKISEEDRAVLLERLRAKIAELKRMRTNSKATRDEPYETKKDEPFVPKAPAEEADVTVNSKMIVKTIKEIVEKQKASKKEGEAQRVRSP